MGGLMALDKAVVVAARASAITFPAPLLGMFGIIATLLATELALVRSTVAPAIRAVSCSSFIRYSHTRTDLVTM